MIDVTDLCVLPGDSIRRTLEAIDRGAVEVALVVDSDGRMLGTVTDGDIRRALLRGVDLREPVGPVARKDFTAVGVDADRASVLDLMRARWIDQIPVLDDHGHVVGLHLLHTLIGVANRSNVAVVMAGGRGTRLWPYTEKMPKPMMPIAGRPILERIVLHLVGAGFRVVYLAVNYMSEIIERHFGDGERFGCRLHYLREALDRPLGTGGPLSLLPPAVRHGDDPILVMNGDLVTQFDIGALMITHETDKNTVTVGTREHLHQIPFGVISSRGASVVDLEEKPTRSWTVNAGVYVIDPRLVDRVPTDEEFPMTTLVTDCIERGEQVGTHPLDGDWIDVGQPDQLARAQGRVE